jgi:two-component system, OmpR family, KDP operon response regulator KdpE
MAGERILIVDDEPRICRALRAGLSGRDYVVEVATTGGEALDMVAIRSPDLVILDLMLPDMSGLDVCREIRSWGHLPIIVLSAKGAEDDKVDALDLGANDYLTKPFGMEELLARVRVALRLTAGPPPPPVIQIGDLVLDQPRHQVARAGETVHLTPTEYELLRYLMLNAGKVITHRALLQAVWGEAWAEASPTLRVFVAQLRRKIEPDRARPLYIRTESGIGYRFKLPDDS